MPNTSNLLADELVGEKIAARILGLSVRTLQQRRYLRRPPDFIRLPGTRSIRYRVSTLWAYAQSGLVNCEGDL